ncbi:hypothetical protein [Shivajiella indica]|uniref:Uncharacterized protein n=1 Tax=Shivajiella indica TaxID=872115 RepID=A0ABW5BBV4_9BACT
MMRARPQSPHSGGQAGALNGIGEWIESPAILNEGRNFGIRRGDFGKVGALRIGELGTIGEKDLLNHKLH